jgi:hypothetical protein
MLALVHVFPEPREIGGSILELADALPELHNLLDLSPHGLGQLDGADLHPLELSTAHHPVDDDRRGSCRA